MFKECLKYLTKILPDKIYIQLYYLYKFKSFISFRKPINFNEHINILKLTERSDLLTICADKYQVRKYVKNVLGEEVLIPLLWSGSDPNEIPFNNLPTSFVIKCNHASGTNIIVRNKDELNTDQIIKQISKWMKYNYYFGRREWCYKNIERRIIIEEFIGEQNQIPNDYKFYVINGKIELIHVDIDRFGNHHKYDLDDNLKSFKFDKNSIELPKPDNFELMKSYAEKVSKDFKFVRADFYNVQGKIYFGEMTFYPSGGFKEFCPPELNDYLGSKF